MTALRQIGALGRLSRLVPVALLSAALTGTAEAQKSREARVILSGDPNQAPYTVNPRRNFNLFAQGDLGVSGMRMTGRFGWHVTSWGPCSDGFIVGECGDVQRANGTFAFNIFEISLVSGAPPTEWNKIKAVHPGAAAALGGGWVGHSNELLLGGQVDHGPTDGTAGRLFSGITSTNDGSCRDHTGALNGYVSTGFSLLATSDCPETWVGGFDGYRIYAESAFVAMKTQSANPRQFRFDDFRVPSEFRGEASELAGNFSTYGLMQDYFREILETFGSATKKGSDLGFTNAPRRAGYPLGIDYRFDAFQYALPAIQNVVFYRLLVINNSAQLYGAGVDYDSLYMGLRAGWGRNQGATVYYVPSRNALLSTEVGASGSGNCNGGRTAPGTPGCAAIGFTNGATAIAMLKSPIGDARNKLFTNPGSQFYDPTNVHAGDTITFNHGHMCGFNGCVPEVWQQTERRQFGLMSSTGHNVLDGRTPAAMAAVPNNFYRVFRNADWPTQTPLFNRYVPGNWDYNKDGSPDTLFFDSCHTDGCVRTWSDTMPGTTRYNNQASNVGGVMSAGPFRLRAGDTTEFFYAFVGAPDSSSFERAVDAATDAYNTFFLVPKPPPVPRVAFTSVTPADSTDPVVRIGFTLEAASYTDLFIAAFANNVRSSPDPRFRNLRLLNPTLASQIDAVALNGGNLAEIQIYKSCDDGRTFTADADCDGDPLVDQSGTAIGTGWRPYAVIRPTAAGIVPLFTDANVIGGRTYLYSFVTKSRGFRAVVRDSLGGQLIARELLIVDTTTSPLARNGPTVTKVYVPLSAPAGGARARAVVTNGATTLGDVPIFFRFSDSVQAGEYRLVFGNRFVVREARHLRTGGRRATVEVQDFIGTAGRNGATVDSVVRSRQTFSSDTSITINATAQTTTTTATADSSITTTVVTGNGAVLVNAAGRPYFVSTTLTGTAATPAAFGSRVDFPGFLVTFDQSAANGLTFERIIEPDGDTVTVTAQQLQNTTLNVVETRSTIRPGASGTFDFVFAEDAFGPGAPFANQGVAATEQALLASLQARPAASTASTAAADSAAVVAVIPGILGSGATARTFIATTLPFTVTNTTFGRTARVVVPRRAVRNDTLRLGAVPDTFSVIVPGNIWVPGDTIFLVEDVERDSTIAGVVQVDAAGAPIRVTSPRVTLGPLVLDCTNATVNRLNCNPLQQTTAGGTGYYDYAPNTTLRARYQTVFGPGNELRFTVVPRQLEATTVTASELGKVKVVPNPFVVLSQYNTVSNTRVGDARVIFTGVPANGSLRIYSLSGQYLQEITWTPSDLNGTGDLPYDLRTREGIDLASGLYIFVVKGRGAGGKTEMARGKFVVIR